MEVGIIRTGEAYTVFILLAVVFVVVEEKDFQLVHTPVQKSLVADFARVVVLKETLGVGFYGNVLQVSDTTVR